MSQRYGPSIDGDPLLIVNATGAEAVQLPAGFAGGRSFFVRRTDSTGNTVTVSTISGGSINGTTNGTKTVPGNAEVRFIAGDQNAWTSIGGATSGGTPGAGTVTSTELAAAAVTAGKIATGAVGSSEITDSSVALVDLAGTVQTAIAGVVPTGVKTSAYTASAWDYIPVDTTSGSVTITLPTAPADGTRLGVKHVIQGSTNAVTVQTGGSDVYNKAGGGTSFTLPLVNQGVLLQYRASGAIWYIQADDIPLSQLDTRFAAANLAGVTAATARTNLGLGGAAVLNVGTATGTVAAGDDSRITGAVQVTENVNVVATAGASQTIPAPTSYTQNKYTLTAATCTFTLPTAVAGQSFSVSLAQDGTGGRLAVFTSAKWAGGVAPTLSTGASKIDDLTFQCTDVSVGWKGYIAGLDMR